MKYLVIKVMTDYKGNSSSSRCGLYSTEELADEYIKKEIERLALHKGCYFRFYKEMI